MIESVENIISALKSGTLLEYMHVNVELKRSWTQKYGHKLSALANKHTLACSWLVVGVNDDGSLANQTEQWAKEEEEKISNHINEYLDPIQACQSITVIKLDGSWIIAICVRNPGEVVYWDTTPYTGSGTSLREMEPHEILELRLKLPGLTDYTRQIEDSEYQEELVSQFIEQVKKSGHPMETGYRNGNALRQLGIHGTQAARILFGNCRYRIIKYDVSGEPLTNVTEFGLYRLLTDSYHQEIQRWTANQIGGQLTPPPYPWKALKEALANAVAHSVYFERDGEVILEMKPTELIVSNLCTKDSLYFANRWFSRAHKTVNGLLMETLRLARHVDELGRGKNLIFAESIKSGKRSPNVIIQRAGKYSRWVLTLFGGTTDRRQIRLLNRIGEIYKDEQKTLIAYSLVLWHNKTVAEIKNYIDDTVSEEFADVLSSLDGPIFYYQNDDKIVLNRWAKLLLEEGLDSKQLTPAEEQNLREFLENYCERFEKGYITPKELRRLANMAETPSERTLSSKLLHRWHKKGFVTKVSQGNYRFTRAEKRTAEEVKQLLMKILGDQPSSNQGTSQ